MVEINYKQSFPLLLSTLHNVKLWFFNRTLREQTNNGNFSRCFLPEWSLISTWKKNGERNKRVQGAWTMSQSNDIIPRISHRSCLGIQSMIWHSQCSLRQRHSFFIMFPCKHHESTDQIGSFVFFSPEILFESTQIIIIMQRMQKKTNKHKLKSTENGI